ncbi:hypothetical protein CDL62_17050 [Alkalitalea saponilacus]|nr:hypothetical protein CDL62_17050 [Alkalitalea saponilacus]
MEADYSFENKLKDEVRLTLYSSGSNIKGTKDYNIVEGGIIMLVSLKTCDRDGFGDVIGNEVDSAKVVLSDSSKVIAIWRASGEHFLSESYENLPDFFDWWYWEENRIQHGGSHAEYRYILELIDK